MSQTKPFFIPQKEFDLINSMNEELIDEIVGQSVDIYKVEIDETTANLYGESTTKYFGKGLPVLVSKDLVVERYSICEQCPHLTDEGRCTECGCFMKKKVNLAASSCPIGKWDSTN